MVLAYAWFNLAALQENAGDPFSRDLLEKTLTDAERTEGQRLASNWKKGDGIQR